jgi:hypothetical protein
MYFSDFLARKNNLDFSKYTMSDMGKASESTTEISSDVDF